MNGQLITDRSEKRQIAESELMSRHGTIILKDPKGWFAAGKSFRQALALLSDGAFKLFAYICLEADRKSGRLQATHKELASVLGKSKRIIGSYVDELEDKGVCHVRPGKNQHTRTGFEITEAYWPYCRPRSFTTETDKNASYVKEVRETFLAIQCGPGRFSPADMETARRIQQRGIPLRVLLDAILLGTCRKYITALNNGTAQLIESLAYFESLIAEVQAQPMAEGYRGYLRNKIDRLAKSWHETLRTDIGHENRRGPGLASPEIVQ